jgi:hypothetical protein
LTPFFTSGAAGFVGTVGLVFVSYAGLTKVASVAGEVHDPDRNIPLGMALSLATAMVVYTVGVFLVVALVPAPELREDLTPIATAAGALSVPGLPAQVAVLLIVAAAVAAFASTGNAGILAASRYPLAMGRDGLVSERLARLGRFHTPTASIVLTSLLVAGCIVLFDVSSIAKLASAFQLLLFALLSLAVVVMRESGIAAYDPGYRSPFYPWMHVFGVLAPGWLIAEMGQLAILFTLGLITLTVVWYFTYARSRARRSGAILHAFARLGAMRHEGLDLELRTIVQEKGLRAEDPFDEVVARAEVVEFDQPVDMADLAAIAGDRLGRRVGVEPGELKAGFLEGVADGQMPIAHGTALPHCRIAGAEAPELMLVRCWQGVRLGALEAIGEERRVDPERLASVRAAFFLLSGSEEGLRATLLQEDRVLGLRVGVTDGTHGWIDLRLSELDLPHGCLIALIRRRGETLVPDGSTHLRVGDHLTLLGDPDALTSLRSVEGRRGVPRVPPLGGDDRDGAAEGATRS